MTHISQLMFLEIDLKILIREWYWLRSTRLLTFDHQLNCLKSGGKSEEFALNTSWGLGVASRGEFLEEVAPEDTRIPPTPLYQLEINRGTPPLSLSLSLSLLRDCCSLKARACRPSQQQIGSSTELPTQTSLQTSSSGWLRAATRRRTSTPSWRTTRPT